ncbi:MAG: type III secretion system inner membrane ring subunit SctD [Mailhella sp.]|nr:type III secretion system inner membrane ring subunit SctD [Mailhella sp.]
MAGVVLRIFSGLHIGAEVELCEGTYVVGADDSCDIILADQALSGRHAVLHVHASSGQPSVEAAPLDGVLLLDGAQQAGTVSIPPAHPFQLSTVHLAWRASESEPAAQWDSVRSILTSDSSAPPPQNGSPHQENSEQTVPAADAGKAASAGQDASPSSDNVYTENAEEIIELAPEMRISFFSRLLKWFFAAMAFLLALLLSFSWNDEPGETHKKIVERLLKEAGYDKLAVIEQKEGVTVSGRIASDRERGRLLRLAQHLQFPVYLALSVRSDAADAVKASYNTMGLYPEVTELPPSDHPGLLVRGYIRDGILEEQAHAAAVKNVPALARAADGQHPKLELYSEIRHMQDIDLLLAPAISARGMHSQVHVEYLPGRVVIHGSLTPEIRAGLNDIASDIQQKLGIPIPIDIVNGAIPEAKKTSSPDQTPAARVAEQNKETKAAPEKGSFSPSATETLKPFKVTAVSMGPLKFLTLSTGERVFEGGELPGGYILESIGVEELTISKNNQKTIYPLRGRHE